MALTLQPVLVEDRFSAPSTQIRFLNKKHNRVVQSGTGILLLSLFSNGITELRVPLCLPEIKLLDVSKNSVENISPDFLTGCPKLETLNVSMNKICECGRVSWLLDSKRLNAGTHVDRKGKYFTIFIQNRFSSQSH